MKVDADQNSGSNPPDSEPQDQVIAGALRKSLLVFSLSLMLGIAIWWWRHPAPVAPSPPARVSLPELRTAPEQPVPEIPWTDITVSAGIHFQHTTGATGEKLLPETMGGGCAFFDFDGDEDQDLFLLNSQVWPWDGGPAAKSVLYENDGHGHFTDVTEKSGLTVSLYGMGVACGDYNNDGSVDLFVSGVGGSRLYQNQRGRFRDVTEVSGTGGHPNDWSTSCGWFDFDRDGDLDLYVGQYLSWTRELDLSQDFRLDGGQRAYGRPQAYSGLFPYLYRNDGEGHFTDIAEQAGLHVRNPATGVPLAKSLGVTFSDPDRDGWLDILVANDTVQNLLFRNRGNGTFQEYGALSGLAFDSLGQARGAMGIDAADFRNDGSLGVAIGNFANEMTALYVSPPGQMQFTDEAVPSGLGPATRLVLTFGVLFLDADLDGRMDLFAANGHLESDINKVQASQHYEQPPQLFWNCGSQSETEFVLMNREQAGADLIRPMVGRGAAAADIDGDGDQDLIITASGEPPRLLRNDLKSSNHWLRFRLKGRTDNYDAIGARMTLTLPGNRTLMRQVMPSRSYLSQSELPVTFGLGNSGVIEHIAIQWPNGSTQEIAPPAPDHQYTVEQSVSPEDGGSIPPGAADQSPAAGAEPQ